MVFMVYIVYCICECGTRPEMSDRCKGFGMRGSQGPLLSSTPTALKQHRDQSIRPVPLSDSDYSDIYQ